MNPINILIIVIVIAIPILLIIVINRRLNRNQMRRIQELQGREPEFLGGFRNPIETEAKVISKAQTIVPNAGGYAKVDLTLGIQLPGKDAYQVAACWLVEVDSLDQILPGRIIPVKVDPNKSMRIAPNVPWARIWVFG